MTINQVRISIKWPLSSDAFGIFIIHYQEQKVTYFSLHQSTTFELFNCALVARDMKQQGINRTTYRSQTFKNKIQ